MSRRGRNALSANPVLVGAVTVLVVVTAVFLAYNANTGLPFVPTYELRATVPDAAEVVAGNDVLIGGTRVGQVAEVEAVRTARGEAARFRLQLDGSVGDLPADTRLLIRQRSNVGLKYVELLPGRAARTLPSGATLPIERAAEPVGLDDVLDAYDAPTRRALQGVLRDVGGGLAGRGEALNRSFEALPTVLGDLAVVSALLRAPATELGRFTERFAAAAATVAPVAGTLGDLVDAGATTFGALGAEAPALAQLIDEAQRTEVVGRRALRTARPLLADTTALVRDLRPAVRALPTDGARLATALRRSGAPLQDARRLAAPLGELVGDLRSLARSVDTTGALQRLTDTVRSAGGALTRLAPIQTRCNYLGIWFRNVASVVSEGNPSGTWFRFTPFQKADEVLPARNPVPGYHYATVPDAGQEGECEAGNEGYAPGRQIGRVPGVQPGRTEATPIGTLAEQVAAEEQR